MDAFARCWVQEYELWKEIESCLSDADKPTFASLHATWIRQKQALYSSSLEAMAAYMVKVSNDKEVLASQSLIDRLRSIGRSLGFIKKRPARRDGRCSGRLVYQSGRLALHADSASH